MEIIRPSGALDRKLVRPVVTIGNFDGIHLGHRAILDTVIERARALRGTSVVFTFDPHPRKVLQPDRDLGLLATLEQKLELLEDTEVGLVVIEPFTREFASTPPERFVREILHERFQPVEVYVGYDFHFGRDREGSMRLLTEMGPRLGFAVTVVPEVTFRGEDVNSTRIRELLAEGNVAVAGELLARPYAVRGQVARGDQRGRTIGFPTLNLEPENEILPAAGVYLSRVVFLDDGTPGVGSQWPAVTNVGVRPTFGGQSLRAEAHLLDFEAEVYGRRFELVFLDRIRPEQRFDGPDALRAQIGDDVARARRRFGLD